MLLSLPNLLEISYQNVANLSSEPPVNFIDFVKSDNSLLSPSDLQCVIPVFMVFKYPKWYRNQGFYSFLNAFKHDQRLLLL